MYKFDKNNTDHISIGLWFQVWEKQVQNKDFEAAKKLFENDVVSFGTWMNVVEGLDKLYSDQWKNIWPTINNFKFVKVDLSDFEVSKSVINDVFKKNKNINTFILNAGIYLPDGFDNFSFENAKKTFNTNVLSIYLTLELINKNFKLSSKHTLAIMSSTAGYKGLPKSLLYGPSKAALINLTESIKSENSNDLNIKFLNKS